MNKFAEMVKMVRPEYRELAEHLLSVLIVLSLVYAVFRILQTKHMKDAGKSAVGYGKHLSKKISKSTKLPKRYPCVEFSAVAFVAVSGYVMSIYCIGIFFLLGVFATITENLVLLYRLGSLVVAALFLVAAKYFFASSERARLEVPKVWRQCRRR